jgi:hypothetical protein
LQTLIAIQGYPSLVRMHVCTHVGEEESVSPIPMHDRRAQEESVQIQYTSITWLPSFISNMQILHHHNRARSKTIKTFARKPHSPQQSSYLQTPERGTDGLISACGRPFHARPFWPRQSGCGADIGWDGTRGRVVIIRALMQPG